MVYNSFLFIWLFPIIFMVGNNLTVPYRKYFFLLASYGIYIYYNKWMTFTLIAVSLISYFFAKYQERNQNKYLEKDQEKDLEKNLKKDLIKNLRKDPDKKNCGKETICGKGTICAGVIATILPLVIFKYGHFISENLSSFTDSFGFISNEHHFSIIAPLGISFFTFQALSYVFDVYRKKYPAEQNLSNYLTYMAFFPSMIAGPINRYDQLMPQLNTVQGFNRPLAEKGLKMILWGMFLKVVIADRLQLYINPVFDGFLQESGSSLLMAAILYSIQLYTDFAGYSLMAIGAAATLGYNLKQNFHNPYFSIGITDFWHRWHITLAHWLRDYIYIPLGGSRCSKKRNYANILITFAVSGIWHGANWTFIVWGLLHGLFQVIEKMLGLQKKERIPTLFHRHRILRPQAEIFLHEKQKHPVGKNRPYVFPHHIPVDFLPHEYDRRCMDRDRKDIYQSGHAFRNLREVYLCLYRHRIHQGSDRRNPSFLQSVLSFKDMGEMGHLSIHLYEHPTLRSFRCGSIHLCQILKS